jgi:hypothetical protein
MSLRNAATGTQGCSFPANSARLRWARLKGNKNMSLDFSEGMERLPGRWWLSPVCHLPVAVAAQRAMHLTCGFA